MTNMSSGIQFAIVLILLVLCPLAAGLLLLRYKLTKESEAGTSLKLTDLLMLGSASWARGTRMDLEWRQKASALDHADGTQVSHEVAAAPAPATRIQATVG
jgi:hypothetical protein